MDFGDYERHLRQKFRLSLAIAVIKSKPEHQSIDSYINYLISKIDKNIDDDVISVCSDDFDMDFHTSPNLLEECNDIFNDNDVNTCDSSVLYALQPSSSLCQGNENSQQIDLNDIQFNNSYSGITIEMKNIENNLFNTIYDDVNTTKSLGISDKTNKKDINTNFGIKIDLNKTIINSIDDKIQLTDKNIDSLQMIDENNEASFNLNSINVTNQNDILYDNFNRILDENLKQTNYNYTQDCTHISQSQDECIKIPENLLRKRHSNTKKDDSNKIKRVEFDTDYMKASENVKNLTQDNIKDSKKKNEENFKSNENAQETIKNPIDSQTTELDALMSEYSSQFTQNSTEIFKNNPSQSSTIDLNSNYNRFDSLFEVNMNNFEEFNSEKEKQVKNAINHIDQVIEDIKLQRKNAIEYKEMNTQTEEILGDVNQTNISDSEDDDELQSIIGPYTETITETVPSKVMIEVNKIKSFLNKGSERLTDSLDSGFASDSQKLSGVCGPQSIEPSINEPAHCVLKYLIDATVNKYTIDIVNDISKTIGHLVDRLHSSQSYPSFLETILQNVERFIEDICLDESMENATAKEIEDKIQKLLLLNRSIHIIKITLENLTKKLENIFSNLTSSSEAYEIKKLRKIENLPYIFNLLEILIKRFSNSNTASQNSETGNTQEKMTQKSQISDFWKRKWDPNFEKKCTKINIFEGKDVSLKLSEVLNKYVVNCIDKYGLIAFAALQCFNLLQRH